MKLAVASNHILDSKTDLLVVCMTQTKPPAKAKQQKIFEALNKKLKQELSHLIKNEGLKGSCGESKLIYTRGKLSSSYVLLVGLGEAKNFNLESCRNVGGTIYSVAKQIKAATIITEIVGASLSGQNEEDCAQALTEGFLLASYKFERYLKPTPSAIKDFTLYTENKGHVTKIKSAVKRAEDLAHGVNLARDLVNTPASDMTPLDLARTAQKSCRGISVKIHNHAAIKKLKMGAFLSVARGSDENPPYFIEMHYKPKTKAKKKIALVGKGVTFDTGGYSIKPAKGMETMKDDMSGAAALIGLMSIISNLAPKVEVSAYIAATENMVSGFAQKPGDVCRAMNGKTIEVLNTDAEGRLTLADALHYAMRKKPDYIIDMATLTGACLVALGLRYSGVMGNNQELMDKLIASGKVCGENIWQLPLAEEYREELKSPIADLKNIGSGYAGTITAALFLENFVDKGKWAHLDIAGSAWTDKPLSYIPRGGCGVMVRTLAHFLENC